MGYTVLPPTSTAGGARAASGSTTTSALTATTTRCCTACGTNRSKRASPSARSSCSTEVSGSLGICWVACVAAIPPYPSTRPRSIAAKPAGPTTASCARPPLSARHRHPDRSDPTQQASARAGLPRLSRHPAALPPIRHRAARDCLPTRAPDRCPFLWLDQLDPRLGPRSQAVAADDSGTRVAARPSQHLRFPLIPLRRQVLLTHPTLDLLV